MISPKARSPSLLLGLALAAGIPASLAAETPSSLVGARIVRVDLVGERRAVVGAEARRLVEVDAGDAYDPGAIRRSIQQLFALGRFSDIRVEAAREPAGLALTFRLFPLPRVAALRFEGLEAAAPRLGSIEGALGEAVGLRRGDELDAAGLPAAAERLVAVLRRRGFLFARAEPEARFDGADATVVFHVEPGPPAVLRRLVTRGARPHVLRSVERRLGVRPGAFYSREALERRIEAIVDEWKRRGFYEAAIDLAETPRPPREVDLAVDVRVGPRVRVELVGAELSPRRWDRLMTVVRERSISPDLVEETRANLEEFFRDRGYRDATVRVERDVLGEGDYLVLRFRAELGRRFRVGSIRFEGIGPDLQMALLAVVTTDVAGPFRTAPFRDRVWLQDLRRMRAELRRRGYHRARVDWRLVEREGEPELVDLHVRVELGPRAVVDAIDIEGARAVPAGELVLQARLRLGAPFDPAEVVEARERIATFYRDRGFRRVDVQSRAELDEEGTRARVLFRIAEGPQVKVDRIIVAGLRVTREAVVRRHIALVPGEPLSQQALLDTRQRLVATGLFRDVRIEVLPVDPATQSSDVLVSLVEGPRTSVGYGFGYTERELARVEAELTRRNLLGRDRTASLFARGSVRGNRFIVTYRQPDAFALRLPFIVSAFREEEDRRTFDFIRLGVGLQLSRRLSENRTLFFRYNFQRTRIFNLTVPLEELDRRFRNVLLSTVSLSDVTDSRDDPINPSRGQYRLLDVEYSAKFLGTRSPYLKGLAQQFFYFPLPRGIVAAVALRFGVAQTFREDRDALLPITERFFVGGANTLRGFGLDLASPRARDVTEDGVVRLGDPVGGNVLTLVNAELRFPIVGNLGGVVFSDNGTVYRRLQVIQLLNWRYNVGFGFRYRTPLGPLRIDYGFKLDRRPEELEPTRRLHVSLGHAF